MSGIAWEPSHSAAIHPFPFSKAELSSTSLDQELLFNADPAMQRSVKATIEAHVTAASDI